MTEPYLVVEPYCGDGAVEVRVLCCVPKPQVTVYGSHKWLNLTLLLSRIVVMGLYKFGFSVVYQNHKWLCTSAICNWALPCCWAIQSVDCRSLPMQSAPPYCGDGAVQVRVLCCVQELYVTVLYLVVEPYNLSTVDYCPHTLTLHIVVMGLYKFGFSVVSQSHKWRNTSPKIPRSPINHQLKI